MARPIKEHLDYFPLDTDFYQNRKIKRLLRAQGSKAMAVWIVIMSLIYGDKGYYVNYDDDMCFDISDILGISEGAIKEIIRLCVNYDLFDENQFVENKILTSKGIQEQYQEIMDSLRRANEIEPEYVVNEINSGVNAAKTRVITGKTRVITVKTPQKKRKEKKRNEKKRYIDHFVSDHASNDEVKLLFDEFWEQYPKKVGKNKAFKSFEKLAPSRDLLDRMIESLNVQKLSKQWQDLQFIPHPTTWLNQRRFDDDLEAYAPAKKDNKQGSKYDGYDLIEEMELDKFMD